MTNDILEAVVALLRKHKTVRAWVIWISIACILAASLVAIVLNTGPVTILGRQYAIENIVPLLVGAFLLSFFILSLSLLSTLDVDKPQRRLRQNEISFDIFGMGFSTVLPQKRSSDKTQRGSAEPEDIIDAIKGNLGQLLEYYIMNKGQARNSFRASLTAIIVGFVTIIAGVWLFYSNTVTNNSAYIVAVAGVILQFIGGGYFYLYNRSLIQLNFFFSRLALMQDTLLAIRLSETLPAGVEKTRVLERLIFVIAERGTIAPAYLPEPADKKRPARSRTAKPKAESQTSS